MALPIAKEEVQAIIYYRDTCNLPFWKIGRKLNRPADTVTKYYHKGNTIRFNKQVARHMLLKLMEARNGNNVTFTNEEKEWMNLVTDYYKVS